jgi:hypothetical protein
MFLLFSGHAHHRQRVPIALHKTIQLLTLAWETAIGTVSSIGRQVTLNHGRFDVKMTGLPKTLPIPDTAN